jgi:hypothetical protein
MKSKGILAVLVIALGGIYLFVGLFSLYIYRQSLQLFAYYGISDEIQMSVPEIARAHGNLMGAFAVFTIAGVGVLCVGIGLYLAKKWARKVWLVLIILLTLFHAARLVVDYQLGIIVFLERVGEVALITSLAVLSWKWLRWEAITGIVRDETAAT